MGRRTNQRRAATGAARIAATTGAAAAAVSLSLTACPAPPSGAVDPGPGIGESSGDPDGDPATTEASATSTSGASTDDGSSTTEPEPEAESSTGGAGSTTGEPAEEPQWCEPRPNAPAQFECDPTLQDCAEGQKCVAYIAGDGGAWDATACFDILGRQPDQAEDPCTAMNGGGGGIDSCDVGLMCWNVDAQTNTGVCLELCGCAGGEPACSAGNSCLITNGGALTLCFGQCEPLLQDCAAGEGCYPSQGVFVCAPDASGASGEFGDECEFTNACDVGNACVNATLIEGCDASGCCTPYCDAGDPGSTCPAMLQCLPWYADDPPMGLENVGFCGS